jgi:hypothetical protein
MLQCVPSLNSPAIKLVSVTNLWPFQICALGLSWHPCLPDVSPATYSTCSPVHIITISHSKGKPSHHLTARFGRAKPSIADNTIVQMYVSRPHSETCVDINSHRHTEAGQRNISTANRCLDPHLRQLVSNRDTVSLLEAPSVSVALGSEIRE